MEEKKKGSSVKYASNIEPVENDTLNLTPCKHTVYSKILKKKHKKKQLPYLKLPFLL